MFMLTCTRSWSHARDFPEPYDILKCFLCPISYKILVKKQTQRNTEANKTEPTSGAQKITRKNLKNHVAHVLGDAVKQGSCG